MITFLISLYYVFLLNPQIITGWWNETWYIYDRFITSLLTDFSSFPATLLRDWSPIWPHLCLSSLERLLPLELVTRRFFHVTRLTWHQYLFFSTWRKSRFLFQHKYYWLHSVICQSLILEVVSSPCLRGFEYDESPEEYLPTPPYCAVFRYVTKLHLVVSVHSQRSSGCGAVLH